MPEPDADPARPPDVFRNRAAAGRQLTALFTRRPPEAQGPPVVVLGLARGGLPVAAELAAHLQVPLDVLVVRKLGMPSQPEFAFGAIAENAAVFIDAATVEALGLQPAGIEHVLNREHAELARRIISYRGDRPLIGVREKHVVLVDDGLATGATMRAAVRFVKQSGAAAVTVAVPVGAPESVEQLGKEVDVVCLRAPADFGAVGYWYHDFRAPSDDEIRSLLT